MRDDSEKTTRGRKETRQPGVSAVLPSGALVETVHRPAEDRTLFCVYEDGAWRYESEVAIGGDRTRPYSASNNLIRHAVVLFPSGPEEYGSEEELLHTIRAFIHRYVETSPFFETLATYYVLLTWLYDRFNEVPYLRVRGDPGSGKTRFLLTVGSLCYKPIFASGASTVSPLFRILDSFRGTLILDESDFRLSDERAEVVKILNNGNARGFPVLRSEVSPTKEFNPRAYAVFGPKIIATRGFFEDRALESRCITEELGQYGMRPDIPISLPAAAADEARRIRNQLLLFRFRNRLKPSVTEHLVDRAIEPRWNQIFVPLLSLIEDPQARAEIRDLARSLNRQAITDRGMDTEAHVIEIIRDLLASAAGATTLSVKEIASWFADRFGDEYEKKVTTKWIGSIIRKRLGLKTQKSHGVFVIPTSEVPKLRRLYEKYGLTTKGEEGSVNENSDEDEKSASDGNKVERHTENQREENQPESV